MANQDPYRIKARAAAVDITITDVLLKMRDEEGVDCNRTTLYRARTNEIKTPRDYEVLNAADRVLKRLEAEAEGA